MHIISLTYWKIKIQSNSKIFLHQDSYTEAKGPEAEYRIVVGEADEVEIVDHDDPNQETKTTQQLPT